MSERNRISLLAKLSLVRRGLAIIFLLCGAVSVESSHIPRRDFISFPASTGSETESKESVSDRSPFWTVEKTLKLSVYYETLCPDSLDFLKTQVLPILQLPYGPYLHITNGSSTQVVKSQIPFHALLDIEFIPYGKAMTLLKMASHPDNIIGNVDLANYTFLCQHGPLECEANKLHSCVLSIFPSFWKAGELSLQQNLMGFFICSMELLISLYYQEATVSFATKSYQFNDMLGIDSQVKNVMKSCFPELEKHPVATHSTRGSLTDSKGSNEVFAQIQNCLESGGANRLLKVNGDLTSRLRPEVTFIPWLTFNGVWDRTLMKNGLKDLHRVLCVLMITSLHEQMSGKLKDQRGGKPPFYRSIIGCERYE